MGNDLFDLADRRLQWLGARQGVLAQNVANADTPGWKARDLPAFADLISSSMAQAGSPVRTDAMHLAGTASGAEGAKALQGERAPDGNQVSLDRELEKIAQTDSEHEAVTAVYRKYIGMVRMALGR
jgi:flagellar basal-body rod protein FlgB